MKTEHWVVTIMETTNIYSVVDKNYPVQTLYDSADDTKKGMLVQISRVVIIARAHITSLTAPRGSSTIHPQYHHIIIFVCIQQQNFSISKTASTFRLGYYTATRNMSISNNTGGIPVVDLITLVEPDVKLITDLQLIVGEKEL
jgi:hypothetical protein